MKLLNHATCALLSLVFMTVNACAGTKAPAKKEEAKKEFAPAKLPSGSKLPNKANANKPTALPGQARKSDSLGRVLFTGGTIKY